LTALPDWLATAVASDASEGRGVLPAAIRPLVRGQRVVGPAFTIQSSTDDNTHVKDAASAPPPPGSILVVAGHEESQRATLGGNLAFELVLLGVIGLVTTGVVRDSVEVLENGLPVWGRGVTPLAPTKGGSGAIDVAVTIGEVKIETGDIVIADDDGVVVWPRAELDALLARATARNDHDLERVRELRSSAG
jgi:4-hydroxy-4-methyl-2-oxoglutarate aldolase